MSAAGRPSGRRRSSRGTLFDLLAWLGLILVVYGAIVSCAAIVHDPDAAIICDGKVMEPGDSCLVLRGPGRSGTYEELKAAQEASPDYGRGPALIAAGALLIAVLQVWDRRQRGRGAAGRTSPQPEPVRRPAQPSPEPQPQPQPRGGDAELARSRELLITARALLHEDIERLSQFRGDNRQRLVEETGTRTAPGEVTGWRGPARLHERTVVEPENWDDVFSTTMQVNRITPGYFFSYETPSRGGPRTYLVMTVSAEGRVELSGPPPFVAHPATGENLEMLVTGGR